MRARHLTVGEVEYTAFKLAAKFMTWDEPIPAFGTRFPNVLESCLETPFTMFSRKDLYRGLLGKASILFYLLIKNHPFENGNKRIAVMSLFYFLHKNGKWLKMTNVDLYNFARRIARSNPKKRDSVIIQIHQLLRRFLIDSPF
jgi:death on curing protein